MQCFRWTFVVLVSLAPMLAAAETSGNRLAYLDEGASPYYVGREFPKLVTPQWVGEPGVEAVVILAIDDLRSPAVHEAYLRPILERLKQLTGQAPVSLMTNRTDPTDPILQKWLAEGLSIEAHTLDHPCPVLQAGDLAGAKRTYDAGVDLVASIPGNEPLAFRMPCCDSMNDVGPRFFSQIFSQTTPGGRFLQADSSIFMLFTADDAELPRELVLDGDACERFRKYLPLDRAFCNYVEDYPYPFVVDGTCWELPAAVPSDWEAFHLHGAKNPLTLADWKAAADATVIKQGVMTLCFHAHGWIGNEQIVELIDHIAARHGKKVKFLTLAEACRRLNRNLLAGGSLRAADGRATGARLLDVDADGYLDALIPTPQGWLTRVWQPQAGRWAECPLSAPSPATGEGSMLFGVLNEDGRASVLVRTEEEAGLWHFDGEAWQAEPAGLDGLELQGRVFTTRGGRDQGVRLRDLDGDGRCELIVGNDRQSGVFTRPAGGGPWKLLPYSLPEGTAVVDAQGRDAGLRLVDLDEDTHPDVVFSNAQRWGAWCFHPVTGGWTRALGAGRSGEAGALPPIVRADGTDNGAWFAQRAMWVHNEDTGKALPHEIERRTYTTILLPEKDPPPRSPEESLRAVRVRPGFRVEIAAAEPLVMDPVDVAWGPDGKMWVVEMADYPMGLDGKGQPGGRVRYLEDTDGDGSYDRSTVFIEPIAWPTGVMPWRKGVLVTAAPATLYAEDTDGDGRADRIEPLFTGFGEGNQQHRVNHPRWGLDNWVYLANGDSGGQIRAVATGEVVDMSGRDLRIRPDQGLADPQSGQTQHGRNRNDWGDWFGCNNSDQGWHYALADHYLRRNPGVSPPAGKIDLTDARDSFPCGRVITHCFYDQPTPPDGQPGRWTCICSAMIHRDDTFPGHGGDNLFVADAVYNCVHRMIVEPRGTTFQGRRAPGEERSEFFASADPWCRTTTVRTGPDGALWICDMYRFVIEHPEWIDARLIDKLDLRAGHDKGRIYRVYPVGSAPRPIPRLDRLDLAGLVAALDHPSGWQRDLAQQMLVEKHDPAAVPLLERLAAEARLPQGRLHALCALDGMNALRAEVVARALADPHAGVRRHAVRVSEPLLAEHAELGEAIAGLDDDADPQVRLQLAYSLGEWDDPRAGAALGRLAVAADDPYLVTAVLSSATPHLDRIAAAVLGDAERLASHGRLIGQVFQLAVAQEHWATVSAMLRAFASAPEEGYASWQYELLGDLLDGLARQRLSLSKLAKSDDAALVQAVGGLAPMFEAARDLLADDDLPVERRRLALRILGRGAEGQDDDLDAMAELLVPQTPVDVQLAVVEALGRLGYGQVPEMLLAGWAEQGPRVNSAVLDVLLNRPAWVKVLLEQVAGQPEMARLLGVTRRDALLRHPDEAIRRRAEELLGTTTTPQQIAELLTRYEPVLRMTGDAERGKKMFTEATCGDCHRLADVGTHIGPDLKTLVDRSAGALLIATIDPNRACEDKYLNYTAITSAGLTVTGLLQEETGNSITLVDVAGKPHVILRSELEELVCNHRSHMPEGLEAKLDFQQMADLFAFVGGTGPTRKEFEGNKPELIRPMADGSLTLPATQAEIYGPNLVYESRYRNLGYWTGADDYAGWTLELPAAGTYRVVLEYAVESSQADRPLQLQVAGQTLRGAVSSTGTWERYDTLSLGQVTLPQGTQYLVVRSDGPIDGPLIDLRAVRLQPAEPTPAQ